MEIIMNKFIRVLFVVFMLGLSSLLGSPTKAASNGKIAPYPPYNKIAPNCYILLGIQISFTGTNSDSNGTDYVGITFYDGNGNLTFYSYTGTLVGYTMTNATTYIGIGNIASRPLTVQLVDTTAYTGNAAQDLPGKPVLDQFTIDPATINPSCASLPYVGGTSVQGAPGPAIPSGFVLRTITCDVAVFNAPSGSPVGSNRIRSGQTWYVNPEPKQANGKSWTEIFVGGPITGWIPTACVK
jgi:hypothetical protein